MTNAQKILNEIKPVIREIFWISQCWNDHNFNDSDLIDKCRTISKQLLKEDFIAGDVDACNKWLDMVDDACKL